MRATINFEVNLDEVEEIMTFLIKREGEALVDIGAGLMEPYSFENKGLCSMRADEMLTDFIDDLTNVTAQVQQYRDMLLAFEKARFETILPQDASIPLAVDNAPTDTDPQSVGELVRNMREVQRAVSTASDFDNFLQRLQSEEQEAPEDDKKSS